MYYFVFLYQLDNNDKIYDQEAIHWNVHYEQEKDELEIHIFCSSGLEIIRILNLYIYIYMYINPINHFNKKM